MAGSKCLESVNEHECADREHSHKISDFLRLDRDLWSGQGPNTIAAREIKVPATAHLLTGITRPSLLFHSFCVPKVLKPAADRMSRVCRSHFESQNATFEISSFRPPMILRWGRSRGDEGRRKFLLRICSH